MKRNGCWVEGNWAWFVLALEVLAVGCGGGTTAPSRDGDEQAEAAGAGAAPVLAPGSGVLAGEPPLVWSLRDDTPAGRRNTAAVIDTRRDRLIVFGGDSSEVWSMPLSGDEQKLWLRITPEGDVPPFGAAAPVYDAVADRVVAAFVPRPDPFGVGYAGIQLWELRIGKQPRFRRLEADIPELGPGVFVTAQADGNRLFAQGSQLEHEGFWEWSLESDAWQLLTGTGPIDYPTRLVLDEPRKRLVAFGGLDVRALSLETQTWSSLGRDPCNSRIGGQTLVDARNEQVISLGGECRSTASYSLSDDAWQVAEERVDELGYGAAVIDSQRNRLLALFPGNLFDTGGNAISAAGLDDLLLKPFTPDTRGMAADASAAVVWDPVRQAVIAFGGTLDATLSHRLDSSATWQSLGLPDTERGPSPGGIYDPDARAIVAFGGDFTQLGVTRLFSKRGRGWEPVDVSGPDIRGDFVGVYDSDAKRFVIQGGVRDPLYVDRSTVLGDTWALALDDAPAWTELNPQGDGPGAREQQAGVYDPVGRRLVVYGGRDGQGRL